MTIPCAASLPWAAIVFALLAGKEVGATGPLPVTGALRFSPRWFAPLPAGQQAKDPLPVGAIARLGSGRLRHAGEVTALAFSPDGKAILAGGHQGEEAVCVWDTATGKR